MLLSNFTHRRQQRESDCLVACAAMITAYLGIQADYDKLAKIVRSRWFGTPFGHIRYLDSLGLSVVHGYHGDIDLFARNIEIGLPVLVNVQTIGWPHWQGEVTYHAVVVLGCDQTGEVIYIHDPFFTEAPIELNLTQFMIGWQEQNRQYAVVALTPPFE